MRSKVPTLLRWVLGGLLLWAALSKLANLQEFFGGLSGYRLPIPPDLLKFVAVVLPWLELFCGLMLLAQVQLRAALLWAALLFGVFAIATGQAWARGFTISCGCLNFDFLGLEGTSFGGFLESAGFACVRASLLCIAAIYLLRTLAPAEPAPDLPSPGAESVRG